ncbi:MAG: hypothetical protein WC444_02250 [Candidatus Paceibacterota bacterium]
MDELKHVPSIHGMSENGTFKIILFEAFATAKLCEGPKIVTIARCADKEDLFPVHCSYAGTGRQVNLQVPKQGLTFLYGPNGLRYSLLSVITERGIKKWLVVCEWNRQGLILPEHVMNRYGHRISPRRGKCRAAR